jgi:hypothetical protein
VSLVALKVKVANWGTVNPATPENAKYTLPVADTFVASAEL